MNTINKYEFFSTSVGTEYNTDSKSQNHLQLRAYLSVAFGVMSVVSVQPVSKFNFDNFGIVIQNDSFKTGKLLSDNIAQYSNELSSKSFVDKNILIEQILSFKSLQNNWDGFGALPLGIKCASNAINLIDNIFEDSILRKVTDIHPNPNGTITFEIENKNDEIISIEIGKETFSYFVDFNSLETKFYNKQKFSSFENIRLLKEYIASV